MKNKKIIWYNIFSFNASFLKKIEFECLTTILNIANFVLNKGK